MPQARLGFATVVVLVFAFIGTHVRAAKPRPPEDLPSGVRLLQNDGYHQLRGETISALKQLANPDLAWVDSDGFGGTPIFLWVMHSPDRSRISFTFDTPHWVRREGKTFWALLDGTDFGGDDKARDFLNVRFLRKRIDFPQRNHGDANHSYVKLLGQNDRGGRLFEVVYCSTSGPRAHQEQLKTYLIYASPEGRYFQASEEIGHQGTYPHGGLGESDGIDFNVEWATGHESEPFVVKLRRDVRQYEATEGTGELPTYEYFCEGVLSGSMPMRPKWSPSHFVESDGTLSLAKLGAALVIYFSGWLEADWIPEAKQPEVKAKVAQAWLAELRRLNPNVDSSELLPKRYRVLSLPDEHDFDNTLFEEIRASLRR